MFAVGFAGWVYSKINYKTGGNTKSSIITAGASALIAFLFFLMVLSSIDNFLS